MLSDVPPVDVPAANAALNAVRTDSPQRGPCQDLPVVDFHKAGVMPNDLPYDGFRLGHCNEQSKETKYFTHKKLTVFVIFRSSRSVNGNTTIPKQ